MAVLQAKTTAVGDLTFALLPQESPFPSFSTRSQVGSTVRSSLSDFHNSFATIKNIFPGVLKKENLLEFNSI